MIHLSYTKGRFILWTKNLFNGAIKSEIGSIKLSHDNLGLHYNGGKKVIKGIEVVKRPKNRFSEYVEGTPKFYGKRGKKILWLMSEGIISLKCYFINFKSNFLSGPYIIINMMVATIYYFIPLDFESKVVKVIFFLV